MKTKWDADSTCATHFNLSNCFSDLQNLVPRGKYSAISFGNESTWGCTAKLVVFVLYTKICPSWAAMSGKKVLSFALLPAFLQQKDEGFSKSWGQICRVSGNSGPFIKHCQNVYCRGVHITVDEQLLDFRGRCGFRMYIPNKPVKCGKKSWWLAMLNLNSC